MIFGMLLLRAFRSLWVARKSSHVQVGPCLVMSRYHLHSMLLHCTGPPSPLVVGDMEANKFTE